MKNASTSRRTFLKNSAALAAGAGLWGMTDSGLAAAPGFEIQDLRTISIQPDVYCGWPTVATLPGGRLMVVWSGGREGHVCPFGRVESMVSDDHGETWTYPRILLDSDTDDRDAGLLATARGSILVTTFTSLAYEPYLEKGRNGAFDLEKLARWEAAHRRLNADERKQELGTWMIRSTDAGKTWSPRYNCLVDSPHGPIQLRDGRILYAGKQLWEQTPRVGIAHSKDDGVSWEWLAELPVRPGDDPNQYHELHVVEAGSGKLVLHIRNHNQSNAQENLQCESTDGGQTWTVPHSIGVWGIPSHLMKMSDGRLLMTYGHRRAPIGNQARISADEGASWSEPIILYGRAETTDMGYPSTVETSPGQFLTIWYERFSANPAAQLRQLRWKLD